MIEYTCTKCGDRLNIPEKFAGQRGSCKKCGHGFTVPRPLDPEPTGTQSSAVIPGDSRAAATPAKESKPNPLLRSCLIVLAVVAVGGLVTIAGCALLIGKAAVEVAEEQEARAERQEATIERIKAAPVSSITWEEIDNIYNLRSEFTDLQKEEHWKHYKGKKVQWSGTVSSVSETFGTLGLQVKLNPRTFTSDVLVRLKESERTSAMSLTEGAPVTFIGILDDWGTLMPITLDHGQLVQFSGRAVVEVAEEQEARAERQEATVERIKTAPVSDITWEEIDNIYSLSSDFTDLQKREHWKHYRGKKVKWSGTVSAVSETFGTLSLQVKLNPNTWTSDVLVKLKESERTSAMSLSEGAPVTFIGILDNWGTLMPITLDHGQLVL